MARALAKKLVGCGLDVWWDQDGIEGGHNFTAEIVEAIIRQYYFLFILSKHSVSSEWCRRELDRASELGKTIIPLKKTIIRLNDVPPELIPLELGRLHYIDLRQGVEVAFASTSRALGLGLGQTYDPTDDPFARDGKLVQAIAGQLRYGKSLPNSLNLVQLLSNIGQLCGETAHAQSLFADMIQPQHYTSSRIDYDKVEVYLINGWRRRLSTRF